MRISIYAIFIYSLLLSALAHAQVAYKPGAVIYGVVPPFFGGPPLKAVSRHLDRLQKLGVDVLWISPINETNDQSDISYSVTDFFRIRQDFGSERDLHNLVEGAHRRGMKVILDIIPNHTSDAHPFFVDAQSGKGSKYYNFYERDRDGNYTYYFDWEHLPNLNYKNPDVQSHIADAFLHWVKTFGVDGYRVDVAWGVRERAPGFWPKLRKFLSRHNSNVLMLAEASADDPYYTQNGFDLAYDWTDELGKWAWGNAFANPRQIGTYLHKALTSSRSNPQTIARYINNNDTGQRFITRFGPAVQRLAAVLQFTVPEVPILYTGDEVGAEYEPYEDPGEIRWNDRYKLTPFYSWLTELRELSPALHSGEFVSLQPKMHPMVYAFARFEKKSGSWALPIINFGATSTIEIAWPSGIDYEETVFCDVLELREVHGQRSGEKLRVRVSEKTALILARKSACETLRRESDL